MSKNYFLKACFCMLFGFLLSCDNTTADPINNSLNNPNNPSGGNGGNGGGTTITGPRILEKVTVNNVVNEEYVTTAGFLEKAIFKDEGGPNNYLTGTVTYTNNRISKVKFVSNAAGALTYDYNITYDGNGRISGTTGSMSANSVVSTESNYTYSYDSAGKISKILERIKPAGTSAYIQFKESTLTYSGDNVEKVIWKAGMTDSNGNPDMSTGVSTTYGYQNYDGKISPYTTLPKTFFIIWSLLHPANFYTLSANNPQTLNVVFPSPLPPINAPKTYLYDSQNYPVSDQSQTQKYIYKPL
ncbi:hypothetical protein [Chryseobacterium populi]|uniref:DUF4595 domain-containing protein n=1 Tax=Chryseobacterium populi TaxID=1144316 RepID=J3CAP8_9FLAO|nr:hypothetical protein [Chryseobacterium populi]EJL67666.1 hypothetical protein PMI13_04102 [Chryseobacterium populi]